MWVEFIGINFKVAAVEGVFDIGVGGGGDVLPLSEGKGGVFLVQLGGFWTHSVEWTRLGRYIIIICY